MKKILFISHDANRAGAPILLLNLIGLLRAEKVYEISVLLKDGGVLIEEFKKLCSVCVWNDTIASTSQPSRWYSFNKKKINSEIHKHQTVILKELAKVDIVINNTIANGELLTLIRESFSGKIITYIHELKMGFLMFASPSGVAATIMYSDRFAVPSTAVRNHLTSEYLVPDKNVFTLPYFIPMSSSLKICEEATNNRQPESKEFVVGGCGTADWRKGIDIFIAVALYLKSNNLIDDCKFLWKGVVKETFEYKKLKNEICKADLNNYFELLPNDENVTCFYESIDVFVLTSREDPYPLVVLEAASYHTPTICFENAGGAPEFTNDEAGIAVPYLDIKAMAEKILLYKLDIELRKKHGDQAYERCLKLHYDASKISNHFKKLITFQELNI